MKIYDVVVIGGGPSGLMAAGRAAELGASVLLLEKNKSLGIKLLMSGGGRCNFTNLAPNRIFCEEVGLNGRWLLSGLSRYGSNEAIDFFSSRGLQIKIEDRGRVFPASNQAKDVLKVLQDYINTGGVTIATNATVAKIVSKNNKIEKLILENKKEIFAKNYILASGGKSYPLSGSSGDAYVWLQTLGHKIITPRAALSPVIVSDVIKDLEGLSINEAKVSFYKNNKKIKSESGDFIFTSRGLSGPVILNLSRAIAREDANKLKIIIDFFPNESLSDLEIRFRDLIDQNKQSDLINILSQIIHKRLASYLLQRLDIKSEKKGNGVTRFEREAIIKALKEFTFNVSSLGGFNNAMVTVGGLDLKEVDPKTMKSKIINNLFVAGEVLDLDGPTGGYNLQIAWTTGYLAGENAANLKQ